MFDDSIEPEARHRHQNMYSRCPNTYESLSSDFSFCYGWIRAKIDVEYSMKLVLLRDTNDVFIMAH